MKRLQIIRAGKFFTIFFFLIFAYCGDNGNRPSQHPLVGTWELTQLTITVSGETVTATPEQADMYMTLDVKSDNTVTVTQTENGVPETFNGTWDPSESKVVFTIEDETQITDYTIPGSTLVLSFWDEGQFLELEFTKQ